MFQDTSFFHKVENIERKTNTTTKQEAKNYKRRHAETGNMAYANRQQILKSTNENLRFESVCTDTTQSRD